MTVLLWIIAAIAVIVLLILFIDLNLVFKLNREPEIRLRVLFFSWDVVALAERFAQKDEGNPQEEPENTERKPKKRFTPSRAVRLIKYFSKIVKAVVGEFCRYARMRVCHVYVRVACEDAAETARLYGIVSSLVWSLLEFLSYNVNTKRCDKKVKIFPDFTSEEFLFDIKFIIKIKPIHLIAAAMHLLPLLSKGKAGKQK